MTDPTPPPPRGRHSEFDAAEGAGRPAAELLAAWGGSSTQLTEDQGELPGAGRPARRRHVAESDTGALPGSRVLRGGAAAAATPVGWARPGLSVPGARTAADAAPRTTELAVPPRVPGAAPTGRGVPAGPAVPTGRTPVDDLRPPLSPGGPTAPSADDEDDRFTVGDTDPSWRAGRRLVPDVPPPAGGLGVLVGSRTAGATAAPALSTAELATEVHPVVRADDRGADEFGADDGTAWTRDDAAWAEHAWAEARQHPGEPDGEDGHPAGEFAGADQQDVDRHGRASEDPDPHHHEPDHHEPDHPDPDHHDRTGGLEVLGADDGHGTGGSGGGGRGRGRRGGAGNGGGASPSRRRPVTIVLSLLVLGGLVAGIVFGGQALWRTLNPASEDYAGQGTGAVEVRVSEGDTLRTIAQSLVSADVIASTGPFLDAAEANDSATGIQPGVYSMRQQMSGAAALDLMLHPETRMVTRVTLPEGLTVAQTLDRLAEGTGIPLAEWQAAAADFAAIGLPAYAGGTLEGFLFPATYDVTPDDTPISVLSAMVARADQVLNQLGVPAERRLEVVTKASIVQAEAMSVTDMGMVAQVVENRLRDGMPLQMDSTVNYANGKSGITTTPQDRANPSLYNTYMHPGLPPGAISNPGEDAIQAVLNPIPGEWRYFVVVNPDTGETRFAVTGQEHQQNVLLFQQWLQDNPGN
ncbi:MULTISPECIES: endolytic transglycosylase MltG [unclassified Modestobacter]